MNSIKNYDKFDIINSSYLVSDYANQYFFLVQLPPYFGRGKNSFLLGANSNYFKSNSQILISFFDSYNNPIECFVTKYLQNQKCRIVVQIDQSNNNGIGTLVVVGCLQKLTNGKSVPNQWKQNYNIKSERKILINNNFLTPSQVRFEQQPAVSISSLVTSSLYNQTVKKVQNIPVRSFQYLDGTGHYKAVVDTTNITNSSFAPQYYSMFLSDEKISYNNQFVTFNSGSLTGSLQYSGSTSLLLNGSFTQTGGTIILNGCKPQINYLYSNNAFVNLTNSSAIYLTSSGYIVINCQRVEDFQINHSTSSFTNGSQMQMTSFIQNIQLNGYMQCESFSGSIEGVFSAVKCEGIGTGDIYVYNQNRGISKSDKLMQTVVDKNFTQQYLKFSGSFTGSLSEFTVLQGTISGSYLSKQSKKLNYGFSNNFNLLNKHVETMYQDYFSGSIIGVGALVTMTQSVMYDLYLGTTSSISQGTLLSLKGQSYRLQGMVNNLNLDVISLSGSGSIYFNHKSMLTNNIYVTQSALIKSFNSKIYTGQLTGKFYNTVYTFQTGKRIGIFNINCTQSGSQIVVNTDTLLVFNKNSQSNLKLNGVVGGEINGVITGRYVDDTVLTDYKLNQIFIDKSQYQIFNTNIIRYSPNKFDSLYQRNYNQLFIPKTTETTLKIDSLPVISSSKYIKCLYVYQDQADTKVSDNLQKIYANLLFNDMSIYSGNLSYIEVYYRNIKNKQTSFNLLTTIFLNETGSYTNTFQKQIQLPYNIFKQDYIDFKFLYKNSLNQYSHQQSYLLNQLLDNSSVVSKGSIINTNQYNINIPTQSIITHMSGIETDTSQYGQILFDNGLYATGSKLIWDQTNQTLQINGGLVVNGLTKFQQPVQFNQTTSFNKMITINSESVFNGTTVFNNGITVHSSSYFDGEFNIYSLTILNDLLVGGVFTVFSSSNFNSDVNINSSLIVSGNIGTYGTLTANGLFTANSQSVFQQNALFNGNINSYKTLYGNIIDTTDLYVRSGSYFSGSSSFNNIVVNGTGLFQDTVNINNTLTVNNNIIGNSDIYISGSGNFDNIVTNNIFASGSLQVTGNSAISGSLTVQGNIYGITNLFQYSDRTLKYQITPIDKIVSLEKIKKITGYTYAWRKTNLSDIGFIAQQLQQDFPQIVTTDNNGIKMINYIKIIPYLVQAIKCLDTKIQDIKNGNS